jgi:putative membrane protein
MDRDRAIASADHPVDPRVIFAVERTLLAWVRTGLALMGFGFVVARFGLFLRELSATTATTVPSAGFSRWFGIVLIALGVGTTLVALLQHIVTLRRLARGEPIPARPTWYAVALTVLLAGTGVLMTAYLVTVE